MKRKIFSKLLMVALVIASVSAFVSCKDYDDDINNLQKQIDAKAAISQIESLQSQLTAAQSAAQAAATAAENALKEAQSKTTDAAVKTAIDAAIEKVNKAAEEAATKNAEAIQKAADAAKAAGDDAAAAKTAADEAKAAAEKAYTDALEAIKAEIAKINIPDVSGFLTEAQVKKLIQDNAQAKGEYVTATSLATQLDELKKSIVIPEQFDPTEINNTIAAYNDAISALYSAVTSVELYYKSGAAFNGNNLKDLIFTEAVEKTNTFPAEPIEGEKQYVFTDGTYSIYGDSIVVRVSPTNAQLTADMIQLINSKGESLDDLVEVVKVRPYGNSDDELLTRAANNNGLWLIEFNLKEGKGAYKDLREAVWTDGDYINGRQIRYAVKVNNTKTAKVGETSVGAERGVISAYNLCMNPGDAQYVWDFDVTPNDDPNRTRNVQDIYNRYTNCEDWEIRTDKVAELVWKLNRNENTGALYTIPAVAASNDNSYNRPDVNNVEPYKTYCSWWQKQYYVDNRQRYERLKVEVGEDITIEFPALKRIKGFYVTLDNDFALESNPSEIEAWNSYQYENVGTKTQKATLFKGNKGTIKVLSESAKGDVIGFRVYAVHLDGTIYDPDGRAFYISIPAKEVETVAMAKDATKQTIMAFEHTAGQDYVSDFIEVNTSVFDDLVNSSSPWHFNGWVADDNNKVTAFNGDDYDTDNDNGVAHNTFTVRFYDKNKNYLGDGTYYGFDRDDIGNVKYFKIIVSKYNFVRYYDGETYKQSLTAYDNRTNVPVKTFSVQVTKVMPAMPVTWAAFQYAGQVVSNEYKFYPMPTGDDWTTITWNGNAATDGQNVGIKLNQVFNENYINVATFNFTPTGSYWRNQSDGVNNNWTLNLNFPNTFKLYIDGANWNAAASAWATDQFVLDASIADNRYTLVKSTGNGNEWSLIDNTTAHNSTITYTYSDVSTCIYTAADGKQYWRVAGAYEVTNDAFKFTTKFMDPFKIMNKETLKKGTKVYEFKTTYAVAPDAAGIELQYFKLTGQYLKANPYTDTLAQLLTDGNWKISGTPTITAADGKIYYDITNAATIAADGAVKIRNHMTEESGRPNAESVTQTLTINLVNKLGGKYQFTYSFNMARE